MNIRSLGDIVNNPARASSLAHDICEPPTRKYQGDRTDKVNAAIDQAVVVPSASSESIAAEGGVAFGGLSNVSRSSKLSDICNAVRRFGMWLRFRRWRSARARCDRAL